MKTKLRNKMKNNLNAQIKNQLKTQKQAQPETQARHPTSAQIKKRENYISWDEYFMGVAFWSAHRSKDPNTQVGACIVNREKRIVGIGYNGFPRGCGDDQLPWGREGKYLDTKYPYVVHAEVNAVLNSHQKDLTGCTLFVGLFPCNECAKVIIQSRIEEVVYISDKYAADEKFIASKKMLTLAGVRLRQFTPSHKEFKVDFTKIG